MNECGELGEMVGNERLGGFNEVSDTTFEALNVSVEVTQVGDIGSLA